MLTISVGYSPGSEGAGVLGDGSVPGFAVFPGLEDGSVPGFAVFPGLGDGSVPGFAVFPGLGDGSVPGSAVFPGLGDGSVPGFAVFPGLEDGSTPGSAVALGDGFSPGSEVDVALGEGFAPGSEETCGCDGVVFTEPVRVGTGFFLFLTVTRHTSFFLPTFAVMRAVPFFFAETFPLEETAATFLLLLFHFAFLCSLNLETDTFSNIQGHFLFVESRLTRFCF